MKLLVDASDAAKPKTTNVRYVAWGAAALILVMAVAQLFAFEDFPAVIDDFWLPFDDRASQLIAALIVTLEVTALPFLLSMRVSPLARMTSMVAGWMLVVVWLALLLWQNVSVNVIANNGLLGETVSLPVGVWSIFIMLALGIALAWAAWGMFPYETKNKITKERRGGHEARRRV